MDNDYRRAANITVIIAGIIAFLWLFFKYALGALIPFILGALIAALISPAADLISKKTKIRVSCRSFGDSAHMKSKNDLSVDGTVPDNILFYFA